jgi:hypothetical protein
VVEIELVNEALIGLAAEIPQPDLALCPRLLGQVAQRPLSGPGACGRWASPRRAIVYETFGEAGFAGSAFANEEHFGIRILACAS